IGGDQRAAGAQGIVRSRTAPLRGQPGRGFPATHRSITRLWKGHACMNISPPANPGDRSSLSSSQYTIVMGRQGYVPVVLRLVGMELFKLRRRALSKVVGSIAAVLAIIPFVLVGIGTLVTINTPLESFQPQCQAITN